jgi:hemerythrin-like domain-containing protein
MTTTEKLHAHHEKLIGTIRALAARTKEDPADASLLISYCNEYLVSHAEAEEVTLYVADNDSDFINKMIREHKEIRHSLDLIDSSFSREDSSAVIKEVNTFIELLNKHFEEEENVLMPRLSGKLSTQELESLITEAHQIEAEKKKADMWALFERDHKRIDTNITQLRNFQGESGKMGGYYTKVRKQLLKHIELEEAVLFTAFGEHASTGQMGPVQVMIAEHRDITSVISKQPEGLDERTLPGLIDLLIARLAVHNKKEELILYPLINRTLPRGDREKVFRECYEGLSMV